MKSYPLQLLVLGILFTAFATSLSSCNRRGCRSDVVCVSNYDDKAKRDGDCSGCINLAASNYCPEADEDDGSCLYLRKFYSDFSEHGWIDVWVADSTDNTSIGGLRYEGRITNFPVNIPECEPLDSTLDVTRPPGQYYYEIETQTGILEWGWAIYREEGCRLLDVY